MPSTLPQDSAPRKGGASWTCAVTPAGRVELRRAVADDGPAWPPAVEARIVKAFERGSARGVLRLGAGEAATELDPALSFWRQLGRKFVAEVCTSMEPGAQAVSAWPEPDADELAAAALAVPPMPGGENVTADLLARIWSELGDALSEEAESHEDGVAGYLRSSDSVWHVVGRVCFHLAENKRDPDYPFAFLATYVHQVSKQAKPQHLPLSRALEQYAGAKNRSRLLALLSPLQRAAERSERMRELVDSGDVYHPLAWSAQEAHRFLCELPLYEEAGLVVRVPPWWNAKSRPRPQVRVAVGEKAPARLGLDALLDFDVELTLGGEVLSQQEMQQILAADSGLALIKGQWVEVDREKLSAVLSQWRSFEDRARREGVSFAEAMRMLAGADLGTDPDEAALEDRPEWSEVIAGKWLGERLASLRSPEVAASVEASAGLHAELRPYQKAGLRWLWALRGMELGGCLADDMGLGKTIQVLGALSLAKRNGEEGVDLLIAPASLLDNWRLEAARFAPHLSVFVAHPSHIAARELKEMEADAVRPYNLVVTSYATAVRLDWLRAYDWRSVILDEAQAIKNAAAKQTRAVKALRARWRLALTGTPIENRLGDLWSIFDFLNPGLLGSSKQFAGFAKRLAARRQNAYAPLRKLLQPYILRRLKTDRNVIADLPEKTEVNAYCLLSKRQATLYRRSVEEMAAAIENAEGIARRGLVLSYLMRFKQICNHPSQWLGDGRYEPEDSGKFRRLRELCEEIAARQDKVLIFTQFREMTDPLSVCLAEVFGRPGMVLHGGTAVKKRQELVKRFQDSESTPFMVLSLKAGGSGLNLTAASHVIHFDRWWNPAVENQATDRAFRIGQRKNVLVHKFVCRGTVEERIDALMMEKRKLSERILEGGAESALTELSNDELMALVSLDLSRSLESDS